MESQAVLNLGNPGWNYQNVVDHFGCTWALSHLDCLREVPGMDLITYISENNLFFWPVKDDTNMADDTLPSIQSGEFAAVPILIGTNSNELPLNSLVADLTANVMANLTKGFFDIFGINIAPVLKPLEALYDMPDTTLPLNLEDR
jgi:carboxylesterase type B